MTNKELQDLLKQYPDDMPVSVIDNATDTNYTIDDVHTEPLFDENGNNPVEELILYI